jgi:hypothetical protein
LIFPRRTSRYREDNALKPKPGPKYPPAKVIEVDDLSRWDRPEFEGHAI